MPLGETKDSFLDLKALADASKVKQAPTTNNALIPESSLHNEEEEPMDQWWELGDDITQYEHFIEKHKRQTQPHKCACLFSFLLGNMQDSDDDDDMDEEEACQLHNTRSPSCVECGGSPPGGIVKRSSIMVQVTPGVADTKRSSYRPAAYQAVPTRSSLKKRVRFTKPIGTAVDIQPYYLMSPRERRNYWWQQTDFDAFKLELSFLTHSKQLGGCEIWLGSVDNNNTKTMDPDKWWHKFGHSRRGLERYLSEEQQEVEEAKRLARLAVLREQRRLWFRSNKEEEIARVYRDYTAWSRNLALAAAASDADAVACDFNDALRKTREYYLVKQAIMNGGTINKHTPPFMVPVGLPKSRPPPLCEAMVDKQPTTCDESAVDKSKEDKSNEVSKQPIISPSVSPTSKPKKIAKQAAGFGTGDENVGEMMSAINLART